MAPTETVKNIKRFNYTKGNIQQQIDYFYKKALKYKFESPEEFLSVMAAFGVKTWENDKGYLSFQGTDREGNTIGKILKQIDIDRFADIKKAAGKKRSDNEITDCLVAVESCLEVSSSERQFLRELKRAGIDISYDKENGRYTDMRFVDHVHGTVVNLQDFGDRLTAEMVNIMAEQWKDNPAEEMVPGNGRTFVSMPDGEYHTSELHDKLDEISESIKRMFKS